MFLFSMVQGELVWSSFCLVPAKAYDDDVGLFPIYGLHQFCSV